MAQASQYKKASLMKRCVASFIDGFLLYRLFGFMDALNEGKGIGKGLMGIRTVQYANGAPPTMMQSCLRNWCSLCVCLACVGEGRRAGDLIAGTIVIEDA